MTITLTGQPLSTQHCYRSGNRRTYMVQKCVDLKQDWQWQAKSQWKRGPLQGEIQMIAHLFHGTKTKRDIDNFSKLLLDALTGIVYEDDSQIVSLTITKAYDKKNPRVDVQIHTI